MSSSAARDHRREAPTSSPITALMTNTADSHSGRARAGGSGGPPRTPARRAAGPSGPTRPLSSEGFAYLALHPRAQPQHRFGVQLGDAGLGHTQDLADLAEGQVLVVVEGD